MDSKDFEAPSWVRNANVYFTVEAPKATQSRIDAVGPIGGCDDNDVGAGLHSIHEGEELGDDTALDFSASLLTLGSNRINFIDEDDGRRVLLSLFKSFAQVTLTLTGHLGHDLGAIDGEEKGSGLIGNCAGNERLTCTRRAKHQDATRRLDTNALEKLRVTKGELYKLADLRHLLTSTTNVIVTNVSQIVFLILASDRLAFRVDLRIGAHNTVGRWLAFNHLELNSTHATAG